MESMTHVIEEVERLYEDIRSLPVVPNVDVIQIRRHLQQTYGDFSVALPSEQVLADAARMLRDWGVQVTHPRYFGLFNPSVHLSSVAADALVAAFNPQLAAWSHAPAANEIERHTLGFFARCLGFDPSSSACAFTTGGSEANTSALLAALAHLEPEWAERGLRALPGAPTIYASEESHHSFEKIARSCGLGRESLRLVPVRSDLKMNVAALREQIRADRAAGLRPMLVVGTAGTTAAGVIDPLSQIADLCSQHELWFHVDAAYGGAAGLSPDLRSHLAGLERADSVTWDAHKWLSVPMGAGMFFCKHRGAAASAFEVRTTYMPSPVDEAEDPYAHSFQWSRRFIGLKVFVPLATMGIKGLRALIERQAAMAGVLREALVGQGWRLLNDTPLPVVCFTHPRVDAGAVTLDAILDELHRRRDVWISQVRLAGATRALRACVTSFRTDREDVDYLVRALSEVLASL
jgi:aromatic-L-amino-acid/L-tryptophan decarboxylase